MKKIFNNLKSRKAIVVLVIAIGLILSTGAAYVINGDNYSPATSSATRLISSGTYSDPEPDPVPPNPDPQDDGNTGTPSGGSSGSGSSGGSGGGGSGGGSGDDPGDEPQPDKTPPTIQHNVALIPLSESFTFKAIIRDNETPKEDIKAYFYYRSENRLCEYTLPQQWSRKIAMEYDKSEDCHIFTLKARAIQVIFDDQDPAKPKLEYMFEASDEAGNVFQSIVYGAPIGRLVFLHE